ncbi:hypothetical protein BJ741DRAFT_689298 [Chytriomyces cf. hyalinus JEL632]|nr:hypothetical protein BJ741DRAFT_689298 [Chytriomyces cf. hyalinus JEL632]
MEMEQEPATNEPLPLEPAIITLFNNACESTLENMYFNTHRRQIASLFVARDYLAIFGNPSLLQAYVAAYSPSRSLCYYSLFSSSETLKTALQSAKFIYSVGAGSGGELVGITAALSRTIRTTPTAPTFHSQDIADYTTALAPIHTALKTTFPSVNLTYESSVFDILSTQQEHVSLKTECVAKADVITCFFILNELLANSKKEFVAFVKVLVMSMKQGALLVVVDSAGSFSEVAVGTTSSKPSQQQQQPTYMVYHLLDAIKAFEIVEQADSQWYRYPQGLHYPVKLNNMRHFLRIYRKL